MRRNFIVAITVAAVVAGAIAAGIYLGPSWRRCETAGSACCGPDGEVNTKHCHKGLGCNIVTDKCETSGAPEQPCADGHFTGFSLKGYTGVLLDPLERIESCDRGARCDARLAADGKSWVGTRLCRACGIQEDGFCCAPDVRYAVGRCFEDAATGKRLTCSDPLAALPGICIPCGRWAGDIACADREPCADRLIEKDGFCIACGVAGLPPCDRGVPCRDSAADWLSDRCVEAGGPNQPCLPEGGLRCSYQGTFCNSRRICEPCGLPGQPCCPPGSRPNNAPCEQPGECRQTPAGNRCGGCGYTNGPVCQGPVPCPNDEPVGGWCRPCGKLGQVCCRSSGGIVCYDGLKCREGHCGGPPSGGGGGAPPGPKTCSGQPYTWSTIPRPVFYENANGCVDSASFPASTDEEAVQCARSLFGDDVIGTSLQHFPVAVTCPHTGCNQRTYPARDQDSAEKCAEALSPGCTVEGGPCP